MKIQLFVELLKTRKTDTIIVYHSLSYMFLVFLAHIIRHFRLIYEVEEIYSDVTGKKSTRFWELRLLANAEGYIFPTELLDQIVNKTERPRVIIYGTYRVETLRDRSGFNFVFDNNKIHCVYAGTLDPRKGGAIVAAKVASFLPNNYHIHIIGKGSEENINMINSIIEENRKDSCGIVTYDGYYEEEDFIIYLQSCSIGLSTQSTVGAFNDSSFPSKILTYLANGLHVVSVDIPVVRNSQMANILYLSQNSQPETIAETICKVNLNDVTYNSRVVLSFLANEFEKNLSMLLSK